MKPIINEITTYEVCGFKFKTNNEAEHFLKENTLVFDDYEEGYVALRNKDIEKYLLRLNEDKESFFEDFRNLANSNSMGALYPLTVCNYVMQKMNVDSSEVWGEVSSE